MPCWAEDGEIGDADASYAHWRHSTRNRKKAPELARPLRQALGEQQVHRTPEA
jgi:hypothetical protein